MSKKEKLLDKTDLVIINMLIDVIQDNLSNVEAGINYFDGLPENELKPEEKEAISNMASATKEINCMMEDLRRMI